MGFNRRTLLGARGRERIAVARSRQILAIRQQRERRARDSLAARSLEGSVISLAALIGTDVKDPADATIGQLRDVVVRWTTGRPYPAVTAVVVRSGKRNVEIAARWIEVSPPASVRLRSSRIYAAAIERHHADVAVAHDVLDRQIVDADGVQIVRPADVYLVAVEGRTELVAIEIGTRALLRRLGPRRWRGRIRPRRVIDWATIRSFSLAQDDGVWTAGRRSELAGQAGAGLVLDAAAGEIRRLRASELEAALQAAEAVRGQESR